MPWINPDTWPEDQPYPEAYVTWAYHQHLQQAEERDIRGWLYSGKMRLMEFQQKEAEGTLPPGLRGVLVSLPRAIDALARELAWRNQGEDGPFR